MNLVELSIKRPDDADHAEAMTMVAYAKKFAIESASDSVKAQEARSRIVTRAKALDEARKNGARVPVTALVDQFYADLQAQGGNRDDTSSLIKRLR